MSPIEHVISAAKSIAINGHTPSVALIKGRVGKIPMPIIVQGLQQFKALPKSEWQAIADFVAPEQKVAEANEIASIEVIATQQQVMQQQVNELLQTHLIRRKVDPRVIKIKNSETATGGTVRQISELKEGIDQESAKKIIAEVKSLKLKIQVKIQGEELRADGKKRDDLQEAIAAIRTIDIGQPMEFVNFRD